MNDIPRVLNTENAVRRVFTICVAGELFLCLLDLFLNYGRLIENRSLRHIFNIAREDSLGTWFAAAQALLVGLTALLIFVLQKRAKGWRKSMGWGVLAVFFIYLSADDAATLHERIARPASEALANVLEYVLLPAALFIDEFPSYPWHLVYAPIFAGALCFLFWFLWRRLKTGLEKKVFVLALACWGVAEGIDFIEGLEGVFQSVAQKLNVRNYTVSHLALMTEEFLEMLGMTLLWILFLNYLSSMYAVMCVDKEKQKPKEREA